MYLLPSPSPPWCPVLPKPVGGAGHSLPSSSKTSTPARLLLKVAVIFTWDKSHRWERQQHVVYKRFSMCKCLPVPDPGSQSFLFETSPESQDSHCSCLILQSTAQQASHSLGHPRTPSSTTEISYPRAGQRGRQNGISVHWWALIPSRSFALQ